MPLRPIKGQSRGNRVFTNYSGTAGGDAVIFSGRGRVETVFAHQAVSGVQIFLYDSVTATSGGPFAASGHNIVGMVPANTLAGGAGFGLFGAGPSVQDFGIEFTNGLCHSSASGMPGFTVSFTAAEDPT